MRFSNRSVAVLALITLLGLSIAACSSSSATGAPGQGYVPFTGNESKDNGAMAGPTMASAMTAAPKAGEPAAAPAINPHALIIKTGRLDMQASNPEAAAAQADGIVEAAGGYVSAAARSGDADALVISVTYRIPVEKWDATVKAIHGASGGGTLKILQEQIQTQDVTASAVDMDARLTNLRATERALLGIMDKATTITDTLAVQAQLTTIRGQIEELQAQRNTLGDQAAFSTLAVQFMSAPKTQTTTATGDWNINRSIDDATATLVKIGQGLASAGVWLLIVGLPVGLGLLILFLVYRLFRRIRPQHVKPPETI